MELPTHATRYGVRQTAEIVRVSMLDENGNEVIEAQTGQKYRLQAIIKIMQDMDDCGYLFTIRNITGVMIFGTHTANCGVMLPPVKKGDVIVAGLDIDMNIVNGDYFVTAGVAKFGLEVVNQDVWQDALMIKIPYTDAIFHAACVHLNHEFEYSVVSGKAE